MNELAGHQVHPSLCQFLPDLPLASANPDISRWSRVLLGYTLVGTFLLSGL